MFLTSVSHHADTTNETRCEVLRAVLLKIQTISNTRTNGLPIDEHLPMFNRTLLPETWGYKKAEAALCHLILYTLLFRTSSNWRYCQSITPARHLVRSSTKIPATPLHSSYRQPIDIAAYFKTLRSSPFNVLSTWHVNEAWVEYKSVWLRKGIGKYYLSAEKLTLRLIEWNVLPVNQRPSVLKEDCALCILGSVKQV